ncbi:DUF4956 domain-containing protein [Candidatus Poribacteria bacterium]|nr:DUF4956 domain-containing protein [Candidatus Poribacteria bacterium]
MLEFFTLPSFTALGGNALRILLSFVLSVFIVLIYQWTHAKAPQKSFTDTLIILCMLISVVMVIIGDSIARAFSLVGALSIIRFRTAIQDPRDIGFVFFALAAGMAVGAGSPAVAILATFLIGIIILCMYHWHQHFAKDNEFTLEICLLPDQQSETVYRPIFNKHITYERLIEKRIKKSQVVELNFRVKLAKPNEWLTFYNELSKHESITEVKLDQE